MRLEWIVNASGGVMLTVLVSQSGAIQRQPADRPGDNWPMYRGSYSGIGYSPLTQINRQNAARLTQAWTYSLQGDAPAATEKAGPGGVNSQATPIVVDGVMYLPAAGRVVAIEPETGSDLAI